jgi:hypothetical protein
MAGVHLDEAHQVVGALHDPAVLRVALDGVPG